MMLSKLNAQPDGQTHDLEEKNMYVETPKQEE